MGDVFDYDIKNGIIESLGTHRTLKDFIEVDIEIFDNFMKNYYRDITTNRGSYFTDFYDTHDYCTRKNKKGKQLRGNYKIARSVFGYGEVRFYLYCPPKLKQILLGVQEAN